MRYQVLLMSVLSVAAFAAPGPDKRLAALLHKGQYAALRDALKSKELQQRKKTGRPYWFPTSAVDTQAGSRSRSALQESADLLLKISQLDLAEEAYRTALKTAVEPRAQAELLNGLGAAQLLQNGGEDLASYRKSLVTFRQAAEIRVADNNLAALSRLGVCYASWRAWVYLGKTPGRLTDPIEACSQALEQKPRDAIAADAYEALAGMNMDAGDQISGEMYLKQALARLRAAKAAGGHVDSEIARLQGRLEHGAH